MALESLKLMLNEITEEFIQTLDENQVTILLDWLRNGGKTTMDQFCKLSKEERQEVLDFIGDFEAYAELEIQGQKYLLVHAGLNDFYYKKPIEEYTIDDLLWTRTDYEMPYYEDKIVITGHTPTQTILGNDRPGYIYRKYNHIALDCGACSHNGRLAGICLETGKEYYSRE